MSINVFITCFHFNRGELLWRNLLRRLSETGTIFRSSFQSVKVMCYRKHSWHSIQFLFTFHFSIDGIIYSFSYRICAAQRQIGETSLNETSSRSHQILRLVGMLHLSKLLFFYQSCAWSYCCVQWCNLADCWKLCSWLCWSWKFKHACSFCGIIQLTS